MRSLFFVLFLGWVVTTSAADLSLPSLTGRVVDAAGLLDESRKSALEQRLAGHEANTTEQVVVATVLSLEGRTIEEYANLLFREWGLGQRETNNGVLLLVAPNERKVRIEVGYGLEGKLTDLLSADIIQRRIVPRFKEGDYAAGVEGGVDGILGVLTGEMTEVSEPQQVAGPSLDTDAMAPGLFLLVIASALSNLLFKRRYMAARAAVFGLAGAGFGWWMTHLLPVAAFFALFAALFAVGSGGGSGSGSGSRGWSSGGGGGGFSGGGGSSGGGGASGSW